MNRRAWILPVEDRIERSLDSTPQGSSLTPWKRKGARMITTLVACIAVAVIVSGALLFLDTGADQPTATTPGSSSGVGIEMPHPILGIITDSIGDPVPDCVVTVTDVTLGESGVETTGSDGRYSYDLANLPGEYAVGDEILVEAVKDELSGSATIYVSSGFYDTVDITLSTAIPEFSMVIVPVVGMMALFAVVGLRRRKAEA